MPYRLRYAVLFKFAACHQPKQYADDYKGGKRDNGNNKVELRRKGKAEYVFADIHKVYIERHSERRTEQADEQHYKGDYSAVYARNGFICCTKQL